MEQEKFTLLRRFQYTSEAIIFQGKLESQGIEVFLRDNNTIDSNPLYSNAIGGVKLFVKTEDYEKAEEVLDEVNLYVVDEENQPVKCPKCGNEQIDMVTSIKDWKSFMSFAFFILLYIAPFSVKHKYKCGGCKFEFNF
jgi:DNA-directed RNA polymerase subunit RPC12/RpoP